MKLCKYEINVVPYCFLFDILTPLFTVPTIIGIKLLPGYLSITSIFIPRILCTFFYFHNYFTKNSSNIYNTYSTIIIT